MTLQEALTATPQLYPISIHPHADSIQFISLTERDYQAASFLDHRLMNPTTKYSWIGADEVRGATMILKKRCHFMFHISHCGSTLLSRLIGLHPQVFSLREPAIMRSLAQGSAREDIDMYLSLWSRTFHNEQSAIIKATSYVNAIAEDLLTRVQNSRAALIYIQPMIFINSLLGGAMSDIAQNKHHRYERLMNIIDYDNQGCDALSPGECVAMSWLCEMSSLTLLAKRFPQRVEWLDFDHFLNHPSQAMRQLLRCYGVTTNEDALSIIINHEIMKQYAKNTDIVYNSELRKHLLAKSGHDNRVEIDRGIKWLKRISSQCYATDSLIATTIQGAMS